MAATFFKGAAYHMYARHPEVSESPTRPSRGWSSTSFPPPGHTPIWANPHRPPVLGREIRCITFPLAPLALSIAIIIAPRALAYRKLLGDLAGPVLYFPHAHSPIPPPPHTHTPTTTRFPIRPKHTRLPKFRGLLWSRAAQTSGAPYGRGLGSAEARRDREKHCVPRQRWRIWGGGIWRAWRATPR